jgi:hypothetical protein
MMIRPKMLDIENIVHAIGVWESEAVRSRTNYFGDFKRSQVTLHELLPWSFPFYKLQHEWINKHFVSCLENVYLSMLVILICLSISA